MKNEKNREWFLLVVTTILCVVPILFVLPFYEQLPAQIGVHWDSHGNINNYVSKPMAVFGIPVLMAVFNLGVNFINEADPRRKNTSKKIRFLLKLLLPAICFIFLSNYYFNRSWERNQSGKSSSCVNRNLIYFNWELFTKMQAKLYDWD